MTPKYGFRMTILSTNSLSSTPKTSKVFLSEKALHEILQILRDHLQLRLFLPQEP